MHNLGPDPLSILPLLTKESLVSWQKDHLAVDVMLFKEDALKKEEFENKFKVDVVVYPN